MENTLLCNLKEMTKIVLVMIFNYEGIICEIIFM